MLALSAAPKLVIAVAVELALTPVKTVVVPLELTPVATLTEALAAPEATVVVLTPVAFVYVCV